MMTDGMMVQIWIQGLEVDQTPELPPIEIELDVLDAGNMIILLMKSKHRHG